MIAKFKDLFAQIANLTLLAIGANRSYNFLLKENRVSVGLSVEMELSD